ncbi:hypothetical protein ACJ41O_003661 [Fusarium nematophilum]
MRYNDVRHETNAVKAVLEEYKRAWDKKGMVTSSGLYVSWVFMRQDQIMPPIGISFTAWANAFLNSWNSELVQSLYEKQVLGYVTVNGEEVRLQTPEVAEEFRRIVQEDGADPHDPEVLAKARSSAGIKTPLQRTKTPLPYVLQWLSELGKHTELDGLLRHLDERQSFKWENGGLFYPRDDSHTDEDGNLIQVSPLAGNACVAYARLNVPNGQKIMWEKPWTSHLLARRPWIDGVDLAQGVDCLRGIWDEEESAMILTIRTWEDRRTKIQPTAKNLEAGLWAVYVDGELAKYGSVESRGRMAVEVEVGMEEMDIVFKRIN